MSEDRRDKQGRLLCTANRKSGGLCTGPRVKGHRVCRMHGAGSPQARAKAAGRLADEAARTAVGKLGFTAVDNPLEALRTLAGEVTAFKDALRGHVEKLEQLRYEGEHAEQVRGEVAIYERALDRCATVLTAIARLNIDERLATIESAKVDKIVGAIDHVLGMLDLTVEQTLWAKGEVARKLRSVS